MRSFYFDIDIYRHKFSPLYFLFDRQLCPRLCLGKTNKHHKTPAFYYGRLIASSLDMACVLDLGLSLGRSDTSQTTHFPGLFGFVLKWHLYKRLYAARVCAA